MGLAGGFALTGCRPVVYMQDDGYGNAVNPLSSLQLLYRLPTLLLISWRGEPGRPDAPQHKVMGESIRDLLDRFSIPHLVLAEGEEFLRQAVDRASAHFAAESTPFALLVPKGYFSAGDPAAAQEREGLRPRIDYLRILAGRVNPEDVMLGTTGVSGRELQQYVDHPGKFYMMGSMGCLPAIGLAIANRHPHRSVFVLDGDGALLMKLGTLATVGLYRPANYIHLCFVNNRYESTGGQPTAAPGVDFCRAAAACGYPSIEKVTTTEEFSSLLAHLPSIPKPLFVHVAVCCGTPEGLPRPEKTPVQMRDDLRAFLG